MPTMVVRAISARCSAGSSFTLASRSHGTVLSRALPSSVRVCYPCLLRPDI